MNVTLPRETEEWLRQRLADGPHTSIEELLDALVTERQLAELDVERDDHLWAKADIDAALASLARGDGSPLEEVTERLKSGIGAHKMP